MANQSQQAPTALHLEVNQGPFCPEDRIDIRLFLVPKESYHVRRGSLALVCTEVCYHSTEAGYSKSTNELGRWTESFLDDTPIPQGIPYRSDHSFLVRPGMWPTAHGAIVDISWQVVASFDIAGSADLHSRQPVVVLSSPQHPPTKVVADREYPECDLSFSVSPIYLRTGEVLEGSMQAQMRRDVGIRQVRIELRCTEKAGDRETRTTKDEIALHGQASLAAGETHRWPFRLQVPEMMLPSTRADRSTVTWWVRGIIDRRLRRDLVVERQVQVFTAPRQI